MRSLAADALCDRAILRRIDAFGPERLDVPRSQPPRNISYGVIGGGVAPAPALGIEIAVESPPDRLHVSWER